MIQCFDDDCLTIIDSGYIKHAPLTIDLVRHAIATAPRAVKRLRLLNTHLHSDHCGGNASLQRAFPDLETWIPEACQHMVRTWDETLLTFKATGQRCERFEFSGVIRDGQTVTLGGYEWQLLGAPGHDHTMLVLYSPELKILISSDALWYNGFGVTFPELDGQSGFQEQANTLAMISNLAIDWVIPGHGPAFNDVEEALLRANTKLQYLRANPQRHRELALRVLIKFLLLDHESIQDHQWESLVEGARLFINPSDPRGFSSRIQTACKELEAAGAATRIQGAWCNATPS